MPLSLASSSDVARILAMTHIDFLDLWVMDTQAFFLHALHAIHVSTISGKLSFCHFGTEFSKNWEVFRSKSAESILFLAIFGENVQKYPVFERFGTEFSGKN